MRNWKWVESKIDELDGAVLCCVAVLFDSVLCLAVVFAGITFLDFLQFPPYCMCVVFRLPAPFFALLSRALQHVFRYDKNNIFRLSYFWGAWHTVHIALHSRSCMQSFTLDEMLSHIHFHIWMCWVHSAHWKCILLFFLLLLLRFFSFALDLCMLFSRHSLDLYLPFCSANANIAVHPLKRCAKVWNSLRFGWFVAMPSDHFDPFQWIIDVVFYAFMHWYENIVSIFFDQYR